MPASVFRQKKPSLRVQSLDMEDVDVLSSVNFEHSEEVRNLTLEVLVLSHRPVLQSGQTSTSDSSLIVPLA